MNTKESEILSGNIWKSIVAFALPIALSALLQQLFTAADQAVVGQFAGDEALAAVGTNTSLVSLLVSVFSSFSIGSNAQIAIMIGAGRRDKISKIVHTSITLAALAGTFLLILTQFIAYPVHVFLGTPTEIIDQAVDYLKIYALGFPFAMLYNFGAAILRSKGDTRRPMAALMSAGVLNVILNLLFVIVFHLGVKGVATSTAISNVVSSTWVMMLLLREKDEMRLEPRRLGIDGESLLAIVAIGGPAALQSAVFSIANVSIQSGVNSLGKNAVAGSAAAQNFEGFSYFITNSFSQALTTFCGQNYGAGNFERCRKVIRVAFVENIITAACFDILVTIFRVPIIRLFTSNPDAAQYAYYRIMIVLALHFTITSYELTAAAMRSMGYALSSALLTIFGSVIFRIGWICTVFRIYHDYRVLMAVYPASWLVSGTLLVGFYFLRRKEMQRCCGLVFTGEIPQNHRNDHKQ